MKFLPFFLISFVLALAFNGLDAVGYYDELALLHRDAKKDIWVQAGKVRSLQGSLDVIKSLDKSHMSKIEETTQLRHQVYQQGKHHARKASYSTDKRHDVKAEVELQINRVVSAEKKLNDASNLPHQKAVDAEKLLHSAKSELESMTKRIAMAEELLDKEKRESKKRLTQKYDMAEELLLNSLEENKSQAKEISYAERVLHDVAKIEKSLADKLTIFEPLLRVDTEDRNYHEVRRARQLLHDIKDEIKLQDGNIVRTEKLLHRVTHRIEGHVNKVVKAEELLRDASAETASQVKELLSPLKLLRDVRHEAKFQAENIAQAEKLLGIEEN